MDMLPDMIYKLGDVALLDASLYLLPRLSHALQPPRLTLLRARYRMAVMMAGEYALFQSWTTDRCMHKSPTITAKKWALAFDNWILYSAPQAISEDECITCAHSNYAGHGSSFAAAS